MVSIRQCGPTLWQLWSMVVFYELQTLKNRLIIIQRTGFRNEDLNIKLIQKHVSSCQVNLQAVIEVLQADQ